VWAGNHCPKGTPMDDRHAPAGIVAAGSQDGRFLNVVPLDMKTEAQDQEGYMAICSECGGAYWENGK